MLAEMYKLNSEMLPNTYGWCTVFCQPDRLPRQARWDSGSAAEHMQWLCLDSECFCCFRGLCFCSCLQQEYLSLIQVIRFMKLTDLVISELSGLNGDEVTLAWAKCNSCHIFLETDISSRWKSGSSNVCWQWIGLMLSAPNCYCVYV